MKIVVDIESKNIQREPKADLGHKGNLKAQLDEDTGFKPTQAVEGDGGSRSGSTQVSFGLECEEGKAFDESGSLLGGLEVQIFQEDHNTIYETSNAGNCV